MPHVERAEVVATEVLATEVLATEVLASSTAAMLAGVRADLVVLDCSPEVVAEGVAMRRRIDALIVMLQRVPDQRGRA